MRTAPATTNVRQANRTFSLIFTPLAIFQEGTGPTWDGGPASQFPVSEKASLSAHSVVAVEV
jgi:hypothetical protein